MNSGLVVADRYLLGSPLATGLPLCESWFAMDTRLGAPVTVLLIGDVGRRTVRRSAEQARVARHARLARIIEVGLLESDEHNQSQRSFVVLEQPEGLSFADLFGRRIVPTPVARALIGEAARAVEAAAGLGLRHGAITPEALFVTNRGRVILSGAGVAASLVNLASENRTVTERDDALSLARLFVQAVTRLDPNEAALEDLPTDLTRAERDLAFVVSGPAGRPALADLFRVLAPWNRQLLVSLPLRQASFLRRVPLVVPGLDLEEVLPEWEALAEASETEATGGPVSSVDTLAPEYEPDEDWAFDELEEVVQLEEVPTIPEAILGFLHRRFPSSTVIARLYERASARTLAGPRFNATPWLLMGGLVVVFIIGILSIQRLTSPFTPTVDLNNNPPQQYPDATFGPSAPPSPVS